MSRHLPALLIGLIVAAYWACVLRMAQKSRRVYGHSANLIPKERIGKLTRLIWFPVVALWIALPQVAALGHVHQWWLRPLFFLAPLAWGAVVAGTIALVYSLICWKIMGKSWRMGIDPSDDTPLVTQGPYAYVRHPIYALSSILMLCTVAACPSPPLLAVAAVHIFLLHYEARREEAHLLHVHGQDYQQYRQRTGRFVPRLRTGGS
ncbi:MAG: isoprenylcysteine carboxylmethyltransferase family protein [Tepidisphaeraceae bacterium]|jgi:protein-S-isoprenylcysteine O-methyltransferase Ste14